MRKRKKAFSKGLWERLPSSARKRLKKLSPKTLIFNFLNIADSYAVLIVIFDTRTEINIYRNFAKANCHFREF